MRRRLIASLMLAALIAAACTRLDTQPIDLTVPIDTREKAVLIANAEAAKAGFDLSKFGEPTNPGISGIVDPNSTEWWLDYSTCADTGWEWGCTGFTVTVDKATGKAEALAWQ